MKESKHLKTINKKKRKFEHKRHLLQSDSNADTTLLHSNDDIIVGSRVAPLYLLVPVPTSLFLLLQVYLKRKGVLKLEFSKYLWNLKRQTTHTWKIKLNFPVSNWKIIVWKHIDFVVMFTLAEIFIWASRKWDREFCFIYCHLIS